jgi:hypothetical protein
VQHKPVRLPVRRRGQHRASDRRGVESLGPQGLAFVVIHAVLDARLVFPTAGNTATATSGMGDIAIAIGAGSDADATGGSFDSAFADGLNSEVGAGAGSLDSATAVGTNSAALAGGFSPTVLGNLDIAFVVGTDSDAEAGANATTVGDFDLAAVVFGDMLNAVATGDNRMIDILPSL